MRTIKTTTFAVALLLGVVGVVDAQIETFVGPLSFTITSTDEKNITDKHGYSTRKLVNSSNRATGSIYMYDASTRLPDISLAFAFSDGTTVTVECLAVDGAGVSSKANNTKAVANDQFRAQYSCHMTANDDGRIIETDAVSLYLNGKVRREKGDLTDTISKITLSGCTLSGGADGGNPFLFKGTFSSVLQREWVAFSFSGVWLLSIDGEQDVYLISDGAGSIIEWGTFNALQGTYNIGADGSFSTTFYSQNDPPIEVISRFTSPTTITITTPYVGTMKKISDVSSCSGTWNGTFNETLGATYSVDFTVGNDGAVTNFTGITGPVTGKMFCEAGKVVAFFKTDLDISNPFNQIALEGTRTGDSMSGSLYLDKGGPAANGTFTLVKQ